MHSRGRDTSIAETRFHFDRLRGIYNGENPADFRSSELSREFALSSSSKTLIIDISRL